MPTKATSRHKKSVYGVHPSVAMAQRWVANLPEKTGKPLNEWIRVVKESGPPTEEERRTWLTRKHRFGTNEAWWIAERASGKPDESTDPDAYLRAAEQYVGAMFEGPRAELRPLYDALLKLGLSMGKDVHACPCKTMVPLYRRHVFAEIKPATRTRIDFGFALKDTKGMGRLIDTGGFAKKDRITHRIPIMTAADIDIEVERWLRKAYDLDA